MPFYNTHSLGSCLQYGLPVLAQVTYSGVDCMQCTIFLYLHTSHADSYP